MADFQWRENGEREENMENLGTFWDVDTIEWHFIENFGIKPPREPTANEADSLLHNSYSNSHIPNVFLLRCPSAALCDVLLSPFAMWMVTKHHNENDAPFLVAGF